jgi:hypothetical protein
MQQCQAGKLPVRMLFSTKGHSTFRDLDSRLFIQRIHSSASVPDPLHRCYRCIRRISHCIPLWGPRSLSHRSVPHHHHSKLPPSVLQAHPAQCLQPRDVDHHQPQLRAQHGMDSHTSGSAVLWTPDSAAIGSCSSFLLLQRHTIRIAVGGAVIGRMPLPARTGAMPIMSAPWCHDPWISSRTPLVRTMRIEPWNASAFCVVSKSTAL